MLFAESTSENTDYEMHLRSTPNNPVYVNSVCFDSSNIYYRNDYHQLTYTPIKNISLLSHESRKGTIIGSTLGFLLGTAIIFTVFEGATTDDLFLYVLGAPAIWASSTLLLKYIGDELMNNHKINPSNNDFFCELSDSEILEYKFENYLIPFEGVFSHANKNSISADFFKGVFSEYQSINYRRKISQTGQNQNLYAQLSYKSYTDYDNKLFNIDMYSLVFGWESMTNKVEKFGYYYGTGIGYIDEGNPPDTKPELIPLFIELELGAKYQILNFLILKAGLNFHKNISVGLGLGYEF